ncbi:MAG: class I SAM-dependent methyltransferase [Candidatus Omnitrophota bacterium]
MEQALTYETLLQCDLCGAEKAKVVDKNAAVVQCCACGYKFVQRRPSQKAIAENYDWSFEHCPGWGRIIPEALLMYQRRFNFVEQFIRRGALLDVGAGLGTFLSFAKDTQRWQCQGTETSHYAVNFAKEKFAIELGMGQLENLNFKPDSFDAITLWHVLEHLPSPSRAIAECGRILKAGGFLFIAVPNDSWLGRRHFFKNAFKQLINRLPFKKKLKLKKMYPAIEEEGNKHLSYFTPATLTQLLKKHGFTIKKRSVDFDYEQPNPRLEKKFRRELLISNATGLNLAHAMIFAAQKKAGT